jgi:hypothetical protein
MNEIEWLKSLNHPIDPPAIDVTGSVLGEIRTSRWRAAAEEVSPLAALIALLAGGGAVAAAALAWSSLLDPLAGFAEPLRMVLQ